MGETQEVLLRSVANAHATASHNGKRSHRDAEAMRRQGRAELVLPRAQLRQEAAPFEAAKVRLRVLGWEAIARRTITDD